jgi:FAD/FMN-containing dehydrogenase
VTGAGSRSVTGWGRLPAERQRVLVPTDPAELAASVRLTSGSGLAVGAGRSYGDVGTNGGGTLWDSRELDRFESFDSDTGILRCEPGVLLRDIQQAFAHRGWMLAVTPGTALITVGGAIANDVHGKNHHARGTFGCHVLELTLLRTDGEVLTCSPAENADWFRATIGGLGLTGVIVSAVLQLMAVPGPWIAAEDVVFESLPEFFALAGTFADEDEHTVAWIDVTTDGGRRGIVTRGNAVAEPGRDEPRAHARRVPFTPAVSFVRPTLLPAMNRAYFRLKEARRGKRIEHHSSFFAPLDALRDWNRLYGPRGFYQYQSVVPAAESVDVTAEMLHEVARSGEGSFLGVLKTFGGVTSPGLLSFPREGTTLALDFPNRGDKTLRLLDRLDAIVSEAGGRLYPAKDARMSRALFEQGYPALDTFLPHRDPGISSDLSRRLLGS